MPDPRPRLTPDEMAVYEDLTREAMRRGLATGELAAVLITDMRRRMSAGFVRATPEPGYVGQFNE